MQQRPLDALLGRSVTVDLCESCQCFWFDGHESLQLAPAAVLSLFRLIGARADRPQVQDGDLTRCPRCRAQLRRTRDMQRATRFEYFKCPNEHGRFMTYVEFLKTKDFIKALTPEQIEELRRQVASVNCANCGATVNVMRDAACDHCGSALSLIDVAHARELLGSLADGARNEELRTKSQERNGEPRT
jgi:hypothetical protein